MKHGFAALFALHVLTAQAMPDVRVQPFTGTQGLPANAVQQTAMDERGDLWVATSMGLVRYDGRTWRVWDSRNTPLLPSDEVQSVLPMRDGTVLMAMASGAIRLLRHERVEPIADTDVAMTDLHAVSDRVVLASSASALYRIDVVAKRLVPIEGSVGGPSRIFTSPQGLRAVSKSGNVYAFNADFDRLLPVATGDTAFSELVEAFDVDGQPYLSTLSGWWKIDLEQGRHQAMAAVPGLDIVRALRGPDGMIWVIGRGRGASVCRMRDFADSCVPVRGISVTTPTDLHIDRLGALWISTWDAGMLRVTTPPVAHYAAADGIPSRVMTLLARSDGSVVAATKTSLHVFAAQTLTHRSIAEQVGDSRALALAELDDGRIVMSVKGGIRISADRAAETWLPLAARSSLAEAYGIRADAKHGICLSSEGWWCFHERQWTLKQAWSGMFYDFVDDAHGTVWAAGYGGIFRQDDRGRWQSGNAPPPPGRFITMSALRDTRGHLWFGGYESGLYRYDGTHWLRLDATRGLPSNTAYGLLEDERQRVWVSHDRGLYSITLAQADAAQSDPSLAVTVRAYTTADGIPVQGFSGGSGKAAVESPDGMMWFASNEGLLRIDPSAMPVALPPPTVLIEDVTVDGAPLSPRTELTVAAGTRSISMRIRAPAVGVAERIALRYRLDPLQASWQSVPDSPVEYQRLPPGQYTLRVQSAVDHVWRDAHTLGIRQTPSWWQHPLSWGVAAAVLILVAVSVVRWRLAQLQRRNQQLQDMVEQRSRELAHEKISHEAAVLAQAESERQLHWLRRTQALQQWSKLTPECRLVHAVVARSPNPTTRDQILRALRDLDGDRRWHPDSIHGAFAALAASGLIELDPTDGIRDTAPDFQLLDEAQLPLEQLLADASPRVGAYRIQEPIGEGAMGEVFRALNVHDGTSAAIKLVHRDVSGQPDARRRLKREGELTSVLNHPHIVRMLEWGEHDHRLYLAMEYLEGETLAQRLRTGRLGEPLARDVIHALASALHTLHELGVIHRDLHPGNVMLCSDGRIKLLDFGISRSVMDSAMTATHTILGSLPYMAPELLRREPASPASDVFALGVIAVQVLTGHRIWQGELTIEIISEITRYHGIDDSILAALDPRVAALLRRMVDLNPRNRCSANDVLSVFVAPCTTTAS